MTNEGVLTTKEKELISVSASVAAGCRPCTEYHVKGAHAAGACDRSVTLAIETALAVRESATRAMSEWASRCQETRPELDAEFRAGKRAVTELAAVAAAAAVNSVPDLQARIETARQAGATPAQIRTAIAIAATIQRTAEQKVKEASPADAGATESCCAPASGTPACGCGQRP